MDEAQKNFLRHIHAGVAMHAMLTTVGVDTEPDTSLLVKKAFQIADAMVEAGGPIE